MRGLSQRAFFVTGGASGIGRGACERLAAAGGHVAVADVDGEGAERLAARLRAGGGEAIGVRCDVRDEAAVAGAIAAAEGALGALFGVVTSAGVNLAEDRQPLPDATLVAFERVLGVNLIGTFLVAKHCLPRLADAGGGALVTVASTAGIRGGMGQGFGYTASKGGVVALSQHLAVRYGGDGVRVNCLCPGATAGEGMGSFFRRPEAEALVAPRIPLGRVGQAEELGAVAAYLLSEEASYITGQVLAVDGGATAL